ncbi:hypothetical protein V6N12_048217 [Hibiscus sabdariffa]|uniref:Uncharacterized protein n=1 Tax=Hibiscus sabdariffa TaxID=183260 RepID=A0ABR2EGL4_9ROSI
MRLRSSFMFMGRFSDAKAACGGVLFAKEGTVRPYIPHALPTKRLIPLFHVNVEPMCYSIPLEAAVKQCVLEDARTEPKLKIVAVSQRLFAEIVVFGFAMDDKICPGTQIVIDLYRGFFRKQREGISHDQKQQKME